MNNLATRALARCLLRCIPRRPWDVKVGEHMLRWHVLPRNDWFNVYVHKMVANDDEHATHDHPYYSVSLCLRGAMVECVRQADGQETWRPVNAGDVVARPARFAHRLSIVGAETPVTVFITGPRIREWGFWCAERWVHWRDFTRAQRFKGDLGGGCE